MQLRTTTYEQRAAIVGQHVAGIPLASIAESMQLNFFTVRKWWRRYRCFSWPGLITQSTHSPKGGPLSRFSTLVKYVALRLKRQHPGWGVDTLLLHIGRRPSLKGLPLPKRTALHEYLKPYYHRFRSQARQPTKRPVQPVERAKAVHQCWQMDFKGSIHVPGLGRVTPFNICDEFSSAPLLGELFFKRQGNPVANLSWRHIQAALRKSFSLWGLPQQLRMDRDPLFIGSSRFEWPGSLLLWLTGINVQPIVNPPGRPTYNAQVERLNRTWHEQVGLGASHHSKEQLQQRTDQAWEDRRCHLPSRNSNCHGQPPMKAHPQLQQSSRPFTPGQEYHLFRIQRVYDYLSQWTWRRLVDSKGRISLGGYQPTIAKAHAGQIVKVLFDKRNRKFVAYSLGDHQKLSLFSIPTVSRKYLLG